MKTTPESRPIAFELRSAALQAQDLLLAARAVESRVSALTSDTPAPVVVETAALIKATALQIAALLHGLIAQSERIAIHAGQTVPEPIERSQ